MLRTSRQTDGLQRLPTPTDIVGVGNIVDKFNLCMQFDIVLLQLVSGWPATCLDGDKEVTTAKKNVSVATKTG